MACDRTAVLGRKLLAGMMQRSDLKCVRSFAELEAAMAGLSEIAAAGALTAVIEDNLYTEVAVDPIENFAVGLDLGTQ